MVFFIIGLLFNLILIYILSAVAILVYLIYLFTKAVEKTCLMKYVAPSKLTEGDWLLKSVKVNGKTIKANFHGLTKKDLAILRKLKKKVQVKYGIPFIPVFLIAFLLTVYFGNLMFLLI